MSTSPSVIPPPLLDVRDLRVHFPIYSGLLRRKTGVFKAVDGVSFTVQADGRQWALWVKAAVVKQPLAEPWSN
jgi:ABC-type microcin C transport system duplicated ATPase subunit YejF